LTDCVVGDNLTIENMANFSEEKLDS
jgi:hypothetical protein